MAQPANGIASRQRCSNLQVRHGKAVTECVDLVKRSCNPWDTALWDPCDSKYARSFSLEESSDMPKEFFDRFGFVVFRDVLTVAESLSSVDAIFEMCEHGSHGQFQKGDPSSWRHWPRDGIEKKGWPSRHPSMSEAMLRNRANPRVHDAFAQLLGDTDLLCNHDGVCLQRPTLGDHGRESYACESFLHLDMNPWRYLNETDSARESSDNLSYTSSRDFFTENNCIFASDGLHLQAVLNFADNLEDDGGFWCVPGFAGVFENIFSATPPPTGQELAAVDRNGLLFGKRDEAEVLAMLRHLSMRVPMRAGSLVLWDHRTPHGACRNWSAKFRAAQFLKLFPRRLISPERLSRRASLLRRQLSGFPRDLLMNSVFGLETAAALGPQPVVPVAAEVVEEEAVADPTQHQQSLTIPTEPEEPRRRRWGTRGGQSAVS